MYIELIDLLRCPEPHEESQLVAALNKVEGRHVIEAKLGCPVCGAEFFIRDEVAIFGDPLIASRANAKDADTIRISAFLNLISPGKTVLLSGEWATASASVAESVSARVVSINSPSPVKMHDHVAEIRATLRFPLASKCLDGIALDESHSAPELVTEATRLLRPRGRLFVPSGALLSPQFRLLAADKNEIVAEYVGDLVSLRGRL